MKTYIFSIEYMVPEFADVTIVPKDVGYVQPINELKELALKEFMEMYPEATDPEIIRYTSEDV